MSRSRNRFKLLITIFFSITFACFLTIQTVFASSVKFDVQVPSTSVGVGDSVDITVNITSDSELIDKYSCTITYDPELLLPVSGGTVEEDGLISFGGSVTSVSEPISHTFTFTTLAAGTASIETSATEITNKAGESLDITPAYNSINISAVKTEASTEAVTEDTPSVSLISADAQEPSSDTETEDEVGTLTESGQYTDYGIPEGTIVSVHSSGSTYNVLDKPSSVDVPGSYLPVRIKLNDVDVKAYMKSTDDTTVLLYASNSEGYQGWYFFNTEEGTFLKASDLLESNDSTLSGFMDRNKFVIMLIAIIVLVVLVVIIVILAVSFKGLVNEYENEIDRLKSNSGNSSEASQKANTASSAGTFVAEPVRIVRRNDKDIPTINNKALFPGDDDNVHESYADSDYDNQVSPDEDDYIHSDDYDDTAFDDTGDSDPIEDTDTVKEDDKPDEDTDDAQKKLQASMDKIDEALESAKKYKD